MKQQLRSSSSTQGRRMAGARALWTGKTHHCDSKLIYSVRTRACTLA